MRSGLNMTIQDYFQRIGIRRSVQRYDQGAKSVEDRTPGAFSQVMADALSATRSPSGGRGLRFQDYAANPVLATHRINVVALTPAPVSGIAETPYVQPEKEAKVLTGELSQADFTARNRPVKEPAPLYEKDRILATIDKAAQKYNLPSSLIRAVVQAESGYQVRAVSPAGAQGLMQLMPATAKELGVRNPFNIEQNIDGGAKYLRQMLDQFGDDLKVALSAYNAGPGTVTKYNGNVPYAETRNYVERVLRFSRKYS